MPPTPVPSHIPTSSPSLAPTKVDMVTVTMAMSLTANAPPTADDAVDIRASVAKAANMNVQNVDNFVLTYTTTRRLSQSGYDQTLHRELVSYTWDASFDITTSLADTDYSDPSELYSSVTSTISSDSFSADVAADLGATVVSVDAVLNTRNPSSSPTNFPTNPPSTSPSPLPTSVPTPSPKKKAEEDDTAVILISVFCSVGGVMIIAVAYYLYKKDQEKHKVFPDVQAAIGKPVRGHVYPVDESVLRSHASRRVYPESYPQEPTMEAQHNKIYPINDNGTVSPQGSPLNSGRDGSGGGDARVSPFRELPYDGSPFDRSHRPSSVGSKRVSPNESTTSPRPSTGRNVSKVLPFDDHKDEMNIMVSESSPVQEDALSLAHSVNSDSLSVSPDTRQRKNSSGDHSVGGDIDFLDQDANMDLNSLLTGHHSKSHDNKGELSTSQKEKEEESEQKENGDSLPTNEQELLDNFLMDNQSNVDDIFALIDAEEGKVDDQSPDEDDEEDSLDLDAQFPDFEEF